MILQALKEYYDRKAADRNSEIAPPGWEWKEIHFVLVLDEQGLPVSLDSTAEGYGKAKRVKRFLVPQSVKRTSKPKANVLWDNTAYALGIAAKMKADQLAECHGLFKQRVIDLGEIDDVGLRAVRQFLNREEKAILLQQFGESWHSLLGDGGNISFQLAGCAGLIMNRPLVKKAIQSCPVTESEESSFCLVSGERDALERLHAPIKGVWGAQSSGANIVSFNASAFASYGKEQGANAPVGKKAAFAYTTALNHLLSRDSGQRMQVGDATAVFWSEKATVLERTMVDFFGEPPKDDPDRNTRAVQSLLKAPETGGMPELDDPSKFYVLGLAPNASRIAIRFWVVDTVKGLAEKIRLHFEDLKITHGVKERGVFSLFRLLVAIAPLGKADNIPPNLGGETMRSILQGLPYPQTLLQAAVRRIRAEHEISYPRAAVIKACINRVTRSKNNGVKEELKMSLDESNMNTGYRLGRLFAALEKIQAEAHPGLNATIRDKFYGAASSTPVTVFGNLMRLKNHHLAKLENPGRRVNFERLIGEIMAGIPDFPAHLKLEDQGRFAIGYYHQMQDFFTKKEK